MPQGTYRLGGANYGQPKFELVGFRRGPADEERMRTGPRINR